VLSEIQSDFLKGWKLEIPDLPLSTWIHGRLMDANESNGNSIATLSAQQHQVAIQIMT